MKKLIALLLAALMVFAMAACNNTTGNESSAPSTEATTPSTEATGDGVTVMTHAEFDAAELESAVVIETYVQAIESWYKDACHIYAASEDGGYYIYSYACTQEEANLLIPGTKIRVSGFKDEWAGEVEIMDAKIEILEGTYAARDRYCESEATDKRQEECINHVKFFEEWCCPHCT